MNRLALFVLLSALAVFAQTPTAPPIATTQVQLPIFSQVPIPLNPNTVSAAVVGNPGPAHYDYWIVSNYLLGSSSPAGPIRARSVPNVLTGSNYVALNIPLPQGVVSVDVLRTTSGGAIPSGACACAVATGSTTGNVNDQSNSLSAYTVNPVNSAIYGLTLQNEVQSAGVTHLILRQNNVFVADLSSGGGSTPPPSVTLLGSNGSAAFVAAALPSGQLFVGNVSNLPAPVTLTGDSTLSNAGLMVNKGLNGVALSGLATGILKNTTGTGVPSIAGVADITGLFSGCSGIEYLGFDGNCHTAGTGTVTNTLGTLNKCQGLQGNGTSDIAVVGEKIYTSCQTGSTLDARWTAAMAQAVAAGVLEVVIDNSGNTGAAYQYLAAPPFNGSSYHGHVTIELGQHIYAAASLVIPSKVIIDGLNVTPASGSGGGSQISACNTATDPAFCTANFLGTLACFGSDGDHCDFGGNLVQDSMLENITLNGNNVGVNGSGLVLMENGECEEGCGFKHVNGLNYGGGICVIEGNGGGGAINSTLQVNCANSDTQATFITANTVGLLANAGSVSGFIPRLTWDITVSNGCSAGTHSCTNGHGLCGSSGCAQPQDDVELCGTNGAMLAAHFETVSRTAVGVGRCKVSGTDTLIASNGMTLINTDGNSVASVVNLATGVSNAVLLGTTNNLTGSITIKDESNTNVSSTAHQTVAMYVTDDNSNVFLDSSGTNVSRAANVNVSPLMFATSGGTAAAYSVTLSPAPIVSPGCTTYCVGLTANFLPFANNTSTTPTLSLNAATAKTIVKVGGAALALGDLTSTAIASVIYDGTNWELQNPQTGGSGFTNPMTTLGDVLYGGASGAATRLAGPTTPNSVPEQLISTPSGGAATAPVWTFAGIPVDATSPATLLVTDRANYLKWASGTALAFPAVSGTFASNFPFVLQNLEGATLTMTPNAAASDLIDGSASGTLLNSFAAFVYQDGTTAPGHWFTIKVPTFAAFGSSCGSANQALSWSTTTGFGCQTITNPLSGMTSGQVGIAGSASTITSSKALLGTDASILTATGSFSASNMGCGDGNAGLTPCTAIPNGQTATTQSGGSNDTKVATDAYVDAHYIANGTSALGTSAISSGACATAVTTTATGTLTTDPIIWGFNGDPTGVTGYAPTTNGMLTIIAYPSANNVNFKVCNNTSASVTPGAITLNWKVVR